MQASPRRAAGMRASAAGSIAVVMHQHGGCGRPVACAASIAQPLGSPHSVQRDASGVGVLGSGNYAPSKGGSRRATGALRSVTYTGRPLRQTGVSSPSIRGCR